MPGEMPGVTNGCVETKNRKMDDLKLPEIRLRFTLWRVVFETMREARFVRCEHNG
jgi:hypothetical protein